MISSLLNMKLLVLLVVVVLSISKNSSKMTEALNKYVEVNKIMGMTLEVSQNSTTIYKYNYGLRDITRNLSVDNNTLFRMASLSKSPTSVGILQQVQKGRITLQQDISQLLGFKVSNPGFTDTPITLQMVLSHQSSLIECDAYYTFLHQTYTGPPFPSIKQLLAPEGKYYNTCLFNTRNKPGTYYEYTNYNFAIAATILERVSGQRFDIYNHDHIFAPLGMNSTSYKRQDFLNRPNDISVLYRTNEKKQWVAQADDWKGNISVRDLTQYQIGTNGAVFSPMGGLYSTSEDLTKYTNMLREGGTFNSVQIMKPQSCLNMLRPRFQYNGQNKALNGSEKSYNAYGLGIQTSTYRLYDMIFPNKVVRGHWGDSYGLISQLQFVENYTYVYAINGAYYGYHDVDYSFYETQRIELHEAVYSYLYE